MLFRTEDPGMPERTFETLWSTASEALERIPTRACVETAAVVLATLALSELFSFALSTASVALLFMCAVVVAGIRHGLWMALLGSALSVLAMTLFPWQTRFSAERAEDWVTLACFALASGLMGNVAGRFRRQLDGTRAVADHNERLYEASRLLAGTFRSEDLVRVVREAVATAIGADTVLLLPDERNDLRPAHEMTLELSASDRAAAAWSYEKMRPGNQRSRTGWHFVPLMGAHGALGVLGVQRPPDLFPLMAEERRLLFALCHSAAVAFDRCRLSEDIRTAHMRAETEKLRAALLSSVSHDLRTPLASIIGATSTLSELGDAVPDAQQRELLAMVLSEAERLNRFVGNLLDMARIEYGKLQPRPSWCDVRDVIGQAVQGLNRALASRPLEVEVSDDFPLLHVDSVLLERVLENLVDNAVKYATGDSPVRVTAHIEGGSAMLRVIDRGPGIPPAEREAVLTLAYRVREADKRSAGTGLGLHICRVLIEALGGTIELLDGPQRRGLCAQITLPLAELEEKQEAVAV